MKRIVMFFMLCILYLGGMAMAMEFNDTHNDVITGKMVIARVRQFAALGSIGSGFAFFTATATRHAHWPYWVKRMPLFGFISFNALAQLPTITRVEQNPEKIAFVGNMFNKVQRM